MAQKARKDLAKANTTTLNNLHIVTLTLNALFLALTLLFRRHHLTTNLTLYTILSLPAFICEYILESTGRPKYTPTGAAGTPSASTRSSSASGSLRSAGEDMSAPGLTEYMFDIVWVTWACLVMVVVLGNKGWLLYLVVPAFAAYKGFTLLGMARGMAGLAKGQGVPSEAELKQQGTPGNRRSRRHAA